MAEIIVCVVAIGIAVGAPALLLHWALARDERGRRLNARNAAAWRDALRRRGAITGGLELPSVHAVHVATIDVGTPAQQRAGGDL